MTVMRLLAVLVFLLAVSAWAAPGPVPTPVPAEDGLERARLALDVGAVDLALARIAASQPEDVNDPRWAPYEALRLTALARSKNAEAIRRRLELLPPDAPEELVRKALGHAAWAELALGAPERARAHLLRLLWSYALSPEEIQTAREQVIRTALLAGRIDDAFRAMLRYQQDYAPLPPKVAASFVEALLDAHRPHDALAFAAFLDPQGPSATRLALALDRIAPEEALRRAPGQATAVLLSDIADRLEGAARLDVLERAVALDGPWTQAVARLWQSYREVGRATGNRLLLLEGDDAAWLAAAEGASAARPEGSRDSEAGFLSRAMLAELALRAADPKTRAQSRGRLFAALVAAGRAGTAARLFARAPWVLGSQKAPAEEEQDWQAAARALALDPRALALALSDYGELKGDRLAAAEEALAVWAASPPGDPVAAAALARALERLDRLGYTRDAAVLKARDAARVAPKPAPTPASRARRR